MTGEMRCITALLRGGAVGARSKLVWPPKECGRVERKDPAVRAHNLLIVPLNWQRELPVEEIIWGSMR